MRWTHFLGLSLSFLPWLTLSATTSTPAVNCTEYLRRQGAFQLHRFETDDGICYLSADPFNPSVDMKYRSFLFSHQGLLMVFNSFDPEETSKSHGARVFHFFPRNATPDMVVQGDEILVKSSTAGIEFRLSRLQHQLLGMNGGQATEASLVDPQNAGGVELSKVQALYLDSGFRRGQDPTVNPQAKSRFIDSAEQSCSVKNSEVFKYNADGDPSFKFSDSDLKTFLARRCPALKVNF